MNCEDDVTLNGQNKATPILIAARRGYLEIVKYLVSRGANMEAVTGVRLMKFDICVGRVDGIF